MMMMITFILIRMNKYKYCFFRFFFILLRKKIEINSQLLYFHEKEEIHT
jgi:hypothetical protein